jgi:glycine cleavage system H protein
MTDISELKFPENIRYAKDHEWARQDGEKVRVGITDYAQDQLGDITFAELPEVGADFKKGEQFGTLESTKAVADLFMPVGGEILAINEALRDQPELVNQEPYVGGWIADVKPAIPGEMEELMEKAQYLEMLERAD